MFFSKVGWVSTQHPRKLPMLGLQPNLLAEARPMVRRQAVWKRSFGAAKIGFCFFRRPVARSEFAGEAEGGGAAGGGYGDVGHGVEVVAVGDVGDAEIEFEVFACAVAAVGAEYGGRTPVVGAAGGFEDAGVAELRQCVLLFVFGFAVVDAAYAQLEFFVETAGADVEVDGILGLAALMEAGRAEAAFDAAGHAVDVGVVVEGGGFVAHDLFEAVVRTEGGEPFAAVDAALQLQAACDAEVVLLQVALLGEFDGVFDGAVVVGEKAP